MADKETDALAHIAFREDLTFIGGGEGCTSCRSWQLVDAMTTMNVISHKEWKPRVVKGCDDLIWF